MNAVFDRVHHLGIEGSSPCIVFTNIEVIEEIGQAVDITQMTDAELAEAIVLVNREVLDIRLKAAVQEALRKLPFGGSQVCLAEAGGYPCKTCPDCCLDDEGYCRNESRCTAWDIYNSRY